MALQFLMEEQQKGLLGPQWVQELVRLVDQLVVELLVECMKSCPECLCKSHLIGKSPFPIGIH